MNFFRRVSWATHGGMLNFVDSSSILTTSCVSQHYRKRYIEPHKTTIIFPQVSDVIGNPLEIFDVNRRDKKELFVPIALN